VAGVNGQRRGLAGLIHETRRYRSKHLVGACRQISCYLGEHEIAAVNKVFGELLDKEGRKRGTPTGEECHLTDGLIKLRQAMAEGTRYPALTDEEIAAA
jgi:hypothetical protein